MNDEQTENLVRAVENMARSLESISQNIDRLFGLLEQKLEEEAAQYQDPRSKSFQTRKERSPGLGQLPYWPSGMYYQRRPTESALLWPYSWLYLIQASASLK